jgi:uncharacterized protein (DUF1778 family)
MDGGTIFLYNSFFVNKKCIYINLKQYIQFLNGGFKMKERKNKKDTTLNFRLSEQQKKKISQDAKELGLSVSEYLLELTTDRKIVIVPSGKEIIQAVYQINRELDKWERGPVFSIQAVRDIVSQHLVDIMGKVNQEKEKR